MVEKRGVFIVAGLGLAGLGIYLVTRKKVAGEIPLNAGWNAVTYTGKRQIASVAMQSIVDYLIIAYYYDPFAGIWQQIASDTMLEPDMAINIQVAQDCIWRF